VLNLKKLNKDYSSMDNTVEAYFCSCGAYCSCNGNTSANYASSTGTKYNITSASPINAVPKEVAQV
jgi:putative bacteriocin precursor